MRVRTELYLNIGNTSIIRACSGDEVLEWNGRCLRDKTYEEVYDIIAESKQEPQVELMVSRPIRRSAAMGLFGASSGQVVTSGGPISASGLEDSLVAKSRISRRFTDVSLGGHHYPKHGTVDRLLLYLRNSDPPSLFSHTEALMYRQTSLGAEIPKSRMRISRSSTISGRIQVPFAPETLKPIIFSLKNSSKLFLCADQTMVRSTISPIGYNPGQCGRIAAAI